jgi:hypothetical protein
MEKEINHNFIEDNLLILSKQTMDVFLKEENPADLIALYTFYYYTAKWQKTNQPKCVDSYVKKALFWGIDRLRRTQDKLISMGLIEKINKRDKKGRITGWYVKLNYLWRNETIKDIQNTYFPQVDKATSGKQDINALSDNNINALSDNNINAICNPKELLVNNKKIHKQFIEFWYDICQKIRGIKPKITGKDAKNLKRIIDMGIVNQQQLEQLAVYYLAHPYYRKKNFSPSISTFLSAGIFNSLLDRMSNNDTFWNELDSFTQMYLKRENVVDNDERLALKENLLKLKERLFSIPFTSQEKTKIQENVAKIERKINY